MTAQRPAIRRLAVLAACLLAPALLAGCKSKQLATDDMLVDESFWERSEERRQAVANRDTPADRQANAALASLLEESPEQRVAESRPTNPSVAEPAPRTNAVTPAAGSDDSADADPFLEFVEQERKRVTQVADRRPEPTPQPTRPAPQPTAKPEPAPESNSNSRGSVFADQLAELRAEIEEEETAATEEPSLDWADDVPSNPAPTATTPKVAATTPGDEFDPSDFEPAPKPQPTRAAPTETRTAESPRIEARPAATRPGAPSIVTNEHGMVYATPIDWSRYEEPVPKPSASSNPNPAAVEPPAVRPATNIVPEPADIRPTQVRHEPARRVEDKLIVDSVEISPRRVSRSEYRAERFGTIAPTFTPSGGSDSVIDGEFEAISSGLPTTPRESLEPPSPSDFEVTGAVLPAREPRMSASPMLVPPTPASEEAIDRGPIFVPPAVNDDEPETEAYAEPASDPNPLPLLVAPGQNRDDDADLEVAAVSDPFLTDFPDKSIALDSVEFAEEPEQVEEPESGSTLVWWFAGLGILGALVLVRARKQLLA